MPNTELSSHPPQEPQLNTPAYGMVRRLARRFLPEGLVFLAKAIRGLNPKVGITYTKLWLSRRLRHSDERRHRPPGRVQSVLFVCFGNIIRSPMAEALLKKMLANSNCGMISVQSAGLYACPGRRADARALALAQDFGVSLEHHRSTLLTPRMVAQVDAILVMDFQNEAELLSRYPEATLKTLLLGAYGERASGREIEIADPFGGSEEDVRRCFEILQTCARNLAHMLVVSGSCEDADSKTLNHL